MNNQDGCCRCVTRYLALIGCRSVQMRPGAFWSAPVDNADWQSKLNRDVTTNKHLQIGSVMFSLCRHVVGVTHRAHLQVQYELD